MNDLTTNKPPVWFWIVSVVALIWNAMGIDHYLGQAYNTERWRSNFETSEQIETALSHPSWLVAAFAIAVFAGALGSIALLLRKKWANGLLLLSLLAVIIQMGYLLIKGYTDNLPMTIMIIVFAVLLVWFSKYATSKKWLK